MAIESQDVPHAVNTDFIERVVVHGGSESAEEIGNSCFTLDVLGKRNQQYRIMADFGYLGDFLNDGKLIDGIFLSHAHLDHIEMLPEAVSFDQQHLAPHAKIYGAPQTLAVVPRLLEEGIRLNRDSKYTIFDIVMVNQRFQRIHQPGVYYPELLEDLDMFLPRNGHVPGAMSVGVQTQTAGKVMVTSDICWQNQPIIKGAQLPSVGWPEEWRTLDKLVGVDLTYGGGTKKPFRSEAQRMIKIVQSAIAAGKKVVIFGFQNGRSQNVNLLLHWAKIPTHLDGSVALFWNIFRENRWTNHDRNLPALSEENGFAIVDRDSRLDLIRKPGARVFVTTSGMGDHGPAQVYMRELLEDENTVFIFTSWTSPDSKGRELLEKSKKIDPEERVVTIRTKDGVETTHQLRATIEHVALSAHSDMDAFITFVQDIKKCRQGEPLDLIVLTHGTQETAQKAYDRLEQENLAKELIIAKPGMHIPLLK